MRTPTKMTFAIWVTLVTFAVCMLGIREELRLAQGKGSTYPTASRHGSN